MIHGDGVRLIVDMNDTTVTNPESIVARRECDKPCVRDRLVMRRRRDLFNYSTKEPI